MTDLISQTALEQKVEDLLNDLYGRRLSKIKVLTLDSLLRQRNPYLFRAIGSENVNDVLSELLAPFISSSIETQFGNDFFEPMALWAATEANRSSPDVMVRMSSGAGIDIEIESSVSLKAIAVKSGTKVFNAQSRAKQADQFNQLRSRVSKSRKHFDPVVGYSYGRLSAPKATSTRNYRELAGQAFWADLTGDAAFFTRIIEAMEVPSKKHATNFESEYRITTARLSAEFLTRFSDGGQLIDWADILRFNSGLQAKAAPKLGDKKSETE